MMPQTSGKTRLMRWILGTRGRASSNWSIARRRPGGRATPRRRCRRAGVVAFSVRSVRMVAIPLVAVLAIFTVWGGLTIDFARYGVPDNATPALPASGTLPSVSQRTTRSLGPM